MTDRPCRSRPQQTSQRQRITRRGDCPHRKVDPRSMRWSSNTTTMRRRRSTKDFRTAPLSGAVSAEGSGDSGGHADHLGRKRLQGQCRRSYRHLAQRFLDTGVTIFGRAPRRNSDCCRPQNRGCSVRPKSLESRAFLGGSSGGAGAAVAARILPSRMPATAAVRSVFRLPPPACLG